MVKLEILDYDVGTNNFLYGTFLCLCKCHHNTLLTASVTANASLEPIKFWLIVDWFRKNVTISHIK